MGLGSPPVVYPSSYRGGYLHCSHGNDPWLARMCPNSRQTLIYSGTLLDTSDLNTNRTYKFIIFDHNENNLGLSYSDLNFKVAVSLRWL